MLEILIIIMVALIAIILIECKDDNKFTDKNN